MEIEVRPEGEASNIRTGITTLAYRNSQTPSRMTYTLQTKVKADIDLWDIFWKFSKDSRIRIDIASSEFPQYPIIDSLVYMRSLILSNNFIKTCFSSLVRT
ncbi:CocE/NonD family hydrolase C-terminal non-catalytic domain-containing protein [Paenibacillus agri]|uniref:Xaa-Pro dipeptidyl-peptidase C-terminal domain-containing protein n=1 Tax=Paenibacillus agri TaxID=2744309 RepID=A0A850EMZ8_9BACL|nr:hypothetical protein [Paenibacillus agri]